MRDFTLQYEGEQTKDIIAHLNIDPSNIAFTDLYHGSVANKTTALSLTKFEYMALTHLMKELLWIKLFLYMLSLPMPKPFSL